MTTLFDDSSFLIHRKHKPAQQYASDVISIWMAVDPITSNHPNALTNDELIEERFYIPQIVLLMANKDNKPNEQDSHI